MIELEKGALEVAGLMAGSGTSVSSQSAAMPPAAWVGHVSLLLSDDLLSDDLVACPLPGWMRCGP